MRNIKLGIEYDGTNYVGWQRQENGRSIQGEIENVLQNVLQEKVNVIGAGRTDAGVHARGQVANFRTETALGTEKIYTALNGLLPQEIVIHSVSEASLEFHARYKAKSRRYSYLITSTPTALGRLYSWNLRYKLDLEVMSAAAEKVLEKHDFQSFSKAGSVVDNYFCAVYESIWSVVNNSLQYQITADRFLHGMVRALVGTMVDVGRGYISLDDFCHILELKQRQAAGMAAPARGLVLEEVVY
ncbi:MAG: tRNA pseudouridine(38-40) synthase TruA [Bacteroidota bacterium]